MKMGYFLVVAGAILIIIGCIVLMNSKKETIKIEIIEELSIEDKKDESNLGQEPTQEDTSTLTENEQKGQQFEGWVVEHFNKKYYKILEWRGDKFVNGRYAESNRYPDLELEYDFKEKKGKIAVECKYRSEFVNDGLTWANAENIEIYNRYEEKSQIPVFVVIGVGGTPTNPDRVFVVPLKRLKYSFAKEEYLQPFEKKDVNKNFFYDYDNNVLE